MANNIDEAIAECAGDILAKGLNPGDNLTAILTAWINDLFNVNGGIFPMEDFVNERTVRDWSAGSELARVSIEEPGNVATQQSIAAVIDPVFRTLNAVKFATIRGDITQVQEDATVAAYQNRWD